MTGKMKDNFSWLYGKSIVCEANVADGEIYTYEDGDGEVIYFCSPEVFTRYKEWLDSMPLLKALE